ncbi:hypothetical protein KIW84_013090 [Lathyrus oleraceus]|uniref:Uncharacterized protein n=1 Tax=Pisum sativum TaxID=3888 RepID=A0A9D5GXJ0_PEA|nr:hypothetical protein KIW84_013090 [Pisum sativum]
MGGRVTLLNSVLSSIIIYLFSFYKALKCAIQDIIKIQRDFLWGDDSEKRKMAWTSCHLVCKPKVQCGLGVKHCEMFNLSLLRKWKWRILNEVNILRPGLVVIMVWKQIYKWLDMSFQFELDASDTNFSNFDFMLKEMRLYSRSSRVVEVIDRNKILAWNWFAARTKGAETFCWA